MARLRGVIHRRGPGGEPERYDDGVLRLDLLAREAQVAGVPVRLTAPEFRLLALLTRSAGTAQPVTRIAVHVWGEADRDDSLVRVRILVTRLRRKLDLTGLGGEVIVSARGQGYFYAPPDRAAPPRATRAEPSPGGYGHASRLLGT
ncbi:winged helix-turn-helix domain-containing protein [Prauserella flavalba]|uniref:OmpR/PhoB-type domain-containing protein n=1 Tax=Prauserella flavalba TaxID=1477506 RepID=A0A318LKN2_9PSEU|nr:winged helix-turn-helix domain-containing protein [Prauserella flavalba]PXY34061.1 hypothetical protein BA062_17855 [Prauserella flavalba]